MGIQFCKTCRQSVADSDAVQRNRRFFCPTCDKQLVYFGSEPVRLSPGYKTKASHVSEASPSDDDNPVNTVSPPPPIEAANKTNYQTDPLYLSLKNRLAQQPTNAAAYVDLAKYYSANQIIDDAINTYQAILNLNSPDHHIIACKQLASLYASQKAYVSALSYLKKLAQLTPTDPLVFYNLAIAFMNCQDKPNAQKAVAKAKDCAKTDADLKLIATLEQHMQSI